MTILLKSYNYTIIQFAIICYNTISYNYTICSNLVNVVTEKSYDTIILIYV